MTQTQKIIAARRADYVDYRTERAERDRRIERRVRRLEREALVSGQDVSYAHVGRKHRDAF